MQSNAFLFFNPFISGFSEGHGSYIHLDGWMALCCGMDIEKKNVKWMITGRLGQYENRDCWAGPSFQVMPTPGSRVQSAEQCEIFLFANA